MTRVSAEPLRTKTIPSDLIDFEAIRDGIRKAADAIMEDQTAQGRRKVAERLQTLIQDQTLNNLDQGGSTYKQLTHVSGPALDSACAELGDDAADLRKVVKVRANPRQLRQRGLALMPGGLQALPEYLTPLWRTLEIPVDIPSMQVRRTLRPTVLSLTTCYKIITSSRFHFQNHTASAVVGRSVPVTLTLSSSFTWSDTADTSLSMMYDILADPDAWLISGMRKGVYTASVSSGINAIDPDR